MRLDTLGRRVTRAYASAPACGKGHPKTVVHGRFYGGHWKCLTCQKAISAARRARERAWLARARGMDAVNGDGA